MYEPLEAYLQEVKAQLKALPRAAREDEISEMRLHLQALVNERQKCGESEADAMNFAIAQFGESQEVGRDLKRAWDGPPEDAVRAIWAGLSVLAGYFGYGISLLWWMVFPSFFYVFYYVPSQLVRACVDPISITPIEWFIDTRDWPFYCLRLCAITVSATLPFFSGWIAGRIAPKRATLAIATVFLTFIALWFLSQNFLEQKIVGIAALSPFWIVTYAGAKFSARWQPKRAVRAIQN